MKLAHTGGRVPLWEHEPPPGWIRRKQQQANYSVLMKTISVPGEMFSTSLFFVWSSTPDRDKILIANQILIDGISIQDYSFLAQEGGSRRLERTGELHGECKDQDNSIHT